MNRPKQPMTPNRPAPSPLPHLPPAPAPRRRTVLSTGLAPALTAATGCGSTSGDNEPGTAAPASATTTPAPSGSTDPAGPRSPTATAFVHRRSRILARYVGAWRADTAGTAQQEWLKSTHAALRRYASGAAYQNYSDPDLPDWRKAYYGPAAGRLTRLKKQYDPDRLLTFPQAL